MTQRSIAAHVAMGILLTAGLLAARLTVYAQSESSTMARNPQQREKEREQARNDRDLAMAPIKSQHDLTDYLDLPPSDSPLASMSGGGRARFLASLTFSSKGLSGFDYSDLQSELAAAQIYRVLSLFGMQRTISLIPDVWVITEQDKAVMKAAQTPNYLEYRNYYCQSQGSCAPRLDWICTSNC